MALETVEVRLAVMADREAIGGVMDEGDAHHREALPHMFKKPDDAAWQRAQIEGIIHGEDSDLFVAAVDGVIAGILVVHERAMPDIPLFKSGRFALIDNVAVSKAARRQKLGHALMAGAHEWARGRGLTRVQLSVYAFNEGAIAFYEGLGYKPARLIMDVVLD